MDKDRRETKRSQVAGSVKEIFGKLIGNKQIEDEGAREKAGNAGSTGSGFLTVPQSRQA